MNSKHKKIVTLLLITFLCFHFFFIFNFTAPVKVNTGFVKAVSNRYCYPYFYQQWTVFVPAPKKQYTLLMRNGKQHKWQQWTNITNHLLKRNKYNLFLGREIEILILTNSMNYVVNDLGDKNLVFTNTPNLPSVKVLEHAAKNYFRNYRCWKDGKDYELLLVATCGNKTTTYYFKNLSLL